MKHWKGSQKEYSLEALKKLRYHEYALKPISSAAKCPTDKVGSENQKP